MEFLFRDYHDSANTFQYTLPDFFVEKERGFNSVENPNLEVGIPTKRHRPGCCDYNPKQVTGLTSACAEEDPHGPEIYGDAKKLPDPKIAVLKSDKTITVPGAKPEETPPPVVVEPSSGPKDHSTKDMTDFTDFFRNFDYHFGAAMKRYSLNQAREAENQDQQQEEQMEEEPPQRQTRKRKSDEADEELPKSKSRLSAKSRIKTVKKHR